MLKVIYAVSSPTKQGYARLMCEIEDEEGRNYKNVAWFVKKEADEVKGKQVDGILEESEWNGKTQYKLVVKKEGERQVNDAPAKPSKANLKLQVLNAVGANLPSLMAHLDEQDPFRALEQIMEWVVK